MDENETGRVAQGFEGVERLSVEMIGGDLAITTGPGPARVEAEVIQGPPLEIYVDAGVLRIVHRPTRPRAMLAASPQARVAVIVPEDTGVTARTVSAGVFVSGVSGESSIITVSGRITASGLAGAPSLRTVSGDIEAEGVTGEVDAATVSGEIAMTAADVSAVRARTVSGDITLNLNRPSAVDATTVSGDATFGIAPDGTFEVDAASVSGRLDTTFPHDGLRAERRRLRGRVGEGGPRLAVRTTSGNVAILRREASSALAAAE